MSQQTRMTGDPWLCSAGRHSDANTDLPFQFKPWLEGAPQIEGSMIENLKVTLCQPRRRCSAPETSEGIARSSPKSLYKHFGRAAGAKQNQHGNGARLEKRSKPPGYGA